MILSIGNGTDSRVYVTSDGGASWTQTFSNDDPNAFYDCMTFFDRKRGLALSDPVDGKFRIIATEDGGRSWRVVATDMPAALPGEFAFAASGQCLVSAGGKDAWFATGGGAEARVFHSDDRGKTWEVTSTPIPSGPSAGIFALAFRNPRHGLAVGGDFAAPTAAPDAVALTDDAGATWRLAADPPGEYRSGAHWVTGREVVAVGPTGSDVSYDRGNTWVRFDNGSFDTVDNRGVGADTADRPGTVATAPGWSAGTVNVPTRVMRTGRAAGALPRFAITIVFFVKDATTRSGSGAAARRPTRRGSRCPTFPAASRPRTEKECPATASDSYEAGLAQYRRRRCRANIRSSPARCR